jgi:hypothetical protein
VKSQKLARYFACIDLIGGLAREPCQIFELFFMPRFAAWCRIAAERGTLSRSHQLQPTIKLAGQLLLLVWLDVVSTKED